MGAQALPRLEALDAHHRPITFVLVTGAEDPRGAGLRVCRIDFANRKDIWGSSS
jgi:hypothetical protein